MSLSLSLSLPLFNDGDGNRRYTGTNTLDEPVSATIVCYIFQRVDGTAAQRVQARDLQSIYVKLVQVLYPARQGDEVLRYVQFFIFSSLSGD